MKYFILLSLVIFSSRSSVGQNMVVYNSDTINRIDSAGKRQGYWILTGNMQKNNFYAYDSIVSKGHYLNSMKIGLWTEFYPNGNKKSELFYDSLGRYEGTQYHYYPNGKLQIASGMKNGLNHGCKREYDLAERLIKETYYENDLVTNSRILIDTTTKGNTPEERIAIKNALYSPNCKWECESVTLFKEGKIAMQGIFQQKKLTCGIQCIYDKQGKLIKIKKYEDGKYIGDAALPPE